MEQPSDSAPEIIQTSLVIIAKEERSVKATVSFLNRRGIPTKVVTVLNDAIEMLTNKTANMALLSVNYAHPKIEMIPTLLHQSFNVECIVFAEETDRKSNQRLQNTKTKHILFGPVSGPVVMMRIRQIEKGQSDAKGEGAEGQTRASAERGANGEQGDIKVGGGRGGGDDAIVLRSRNKGAVESDDGSSPSTNSTDEDDDTIRTGGKLERSGETYIQKGSRSAMKSARSGSESAKERRRKALGKAMEEAVAKGLTEAPPGTKSKLLIPPPRFAPPLAAFEQDDASTEELSDSFEGMESSELSAELSKEDQESRQSERRAELENAAKKAEREKAREEKTRAANEEKERRKAEAETAKAERAAQKAAAVEAAKTEKEAKLAEASARAAEKASKAFEEAEKAKAEKTKAEREKAEKESAAALEQAKMREHDKSSRPAQEDKKEAAAREEQEKRGRSASAENAGPASTTAPVPTATAPAPATAAAQPTAPAPTAAPSAAAEAKPSVSPSAAEGKSPISEGDATKARPAPGKSGAASGATLPKGATEAKLRQPHSKEEALLITCIREAINTVCGPATQYSKELGKNVASCLIAVNSAKLEGSFVVAIGRTSVPPRDLLQRIEVAFFSIVRQAGIDLGDGEQFAIEIDDFEVIQRAFESSDYRFLLGNESHEVGLCLVTIDDPVPKIEVAPDQMLKVHVRDLPVETPITYEVFLHLPNNKKYLRYLKMGSRLSNRQADGFDKFDVRHVFLNESDREAYRRHYAASSIRPSPRRRRSA